MHRAGKSQSFSRSVGRLCCTGRTLLPDERVADSDSRRAGEASAGAADQGDARIHHSEVMACGAAGSEILVTMQVRA